MKFMCPECGGLIKEAQLVETELPLFDEEELAADQCVHHIKCKDCTA